MIVILYQVRFYCLSIIIFHFLISTNGTYSIFSFMQDHSLKVILILMLSVLYPFTSPIHSLNNFNILKNLSFNPGLSASASHKIFRNGPGQS